MLGVAITILSIACSIFNIIISFWPAVAVVTVESFNWSLVVFVGVLVILTTRWVLRARNTYKGPKLEISSQHWLELSREPIADEKLHS